MPVPCSVRASNSKYSVGSRGSRSAIPCSRAHRYDRGPDIRLAGARPSAARQGWCCPRQAPPFPLRLPSRRPPGRCLRPTPGRQRHRRRQRRRPTRNPSFQRRWLYSRCPSDGHRGPSPGCRPHWGIARSPRQSGTGSRRRAEEASRRRKAPPALTTAPWAPGLVGADANLPTRSH